MRAPHGARLAGVHSAPRKRDSMSVHTSPRVIFDAGNALIADGYPRDAVCDVIQKLVDVAEFDTAERLAACARPLLRHA